MHGSSQQRSVLTGFCLVSFFYVRRNDVEAPVVCQDVWENYLIER